MMVERTLIRLRDVLSRLPYSRVTLYRWEQQGKFPKRVRVAESENFGAAFGPPVFYYADEIDDWMQSRIRRAPGRWEGDKSRARSAVEARARNRELRRQNVGTSVRRVYWED